MRTLAVAVALVAALVLAACDPPSPLVRLRLADGPVGQCPSTSCADVPMLCATWISIRVVDPADPTAPYLSQCQLVPQDRKKDMCSVASVELDTPQLPLRDLEVQVALFPESMIGTDANGDPICPSDTRYDASSGFPVASAESPAVGGRTYYHPGDDKILVTLGCTNLMAINEASCGGVGAIPITAAVNDFDSGVTFTGAMTVSVGEPVVADPFYVLSPQQLHVLDPVPALRWAGSVDAPFTSYACLAVLDDAPQSTTSVVCRRATVNDLTLDWPSRVDEPDPTRRVGSGVRLSKAALDQMLAALSLTSFPVHGLTIGIVLDPSGNSVANQVVTPSAGTVQYFAGDRATVGGTKTTSSGVWVSTDAPFGTTFSTFGGTPPTTVQRIGGLIDGKVTIVVLQFGGGTGG
ncbi:MAG: hypothetical protein IPQ07_42520 [Myxococcales bacterium]|nr:hypothetical protein [Myxococcales bacterium]